MSTVADIMDTQLPTVSPDEEVETVIRLLREHDLSSVCVVNDGGRCVGIVSEKDFVMRDEDTDLHLPHYIEIMGGVIFLEPMKHYEERITRAYASKISELMTEDPLTIAPDADVKDAAKLIARKGHNRLPVVEHGRYVGVVARADVLAALAEA